MQNWTSFVADWETEIRHALRDLAGEQLTEDELAVLQSGIAMPGTARPREEVILRLEAVGLAPDPDHVEFLTGVGALRLIAMGADDGVLCGADRLAPLDVAHPSIHAAWADAASVTSMERYRATGYVDEPLEMIPEEVVRRAVAISSRAGGLVYAAVSMPSGNDYLRLNLHRHSVKYSSFEEFIGRERDRMLEELKGSLDDR
jgi:hypothetical protein